MIVKKPLLVITGGSKGIGLKASEYLKIRFPKHQQCILSRSDPKNGSVHFGCDVACYDSVVESFQGMRREFEDGYFPDVLINCAGVNEDQLLIRASEDVITKTIMTNLVGTMYTSKEMVKWMLRVRNEQEGKKCIINMSSVVGLDGRKGQTVYAASKSGVIGFTKALAKEVGSRGIRVNAICPGFIRDGGMVSDLKYEDLEGQIELKRLGTSDDVNRVIEFLMDSSYITGEAIRVDGGLTI